MEVGAKGIDRAGEFVTLRTHYTISVDFIFDFVVVGWWLLICIHSYRMLKNFYIIFEYQ